MCAHSNVALGALSRTKRDHILLYTMNKDFLLYRVDQYDAPRTVIANDMDLCARIIHKYHDAPMVATWGAKRLLRRRLVIYSGLICTSGCATGFVRAKSASD